MKSSVLILIYLAFCGSIGYSQNIFSSGLDTTLGNAYYDKAMAFAEAGALDSMYRYCQLALPIFQKSNNKELQGRLEWRMANRELQFSKYDTALLRVRSAIDNLSEALGQEHPETLYANLLFSIILKESGHRDSSFAVIERTERIAARNPETKPDLMGELYYEFSSTYLYYDQYDQAQEICEKFIDYVEKKNPENDFLQKKSRLAMAEFYEAIGQRSEALDWYFQTESWLKDLEESFTSFATYNGIATNMLKLDRADEAIPYLRRSLGIDSEHFGSNTIYYAYSLYMLGKCEVEVGLSEQGMNSLLQSDSIYLTLVSENNIYRLYNLLGQAEAKNKTQNFSEAKRIYKDLLKRFQENHPNSREAIHDIYVQFIKMLIDSEDIKLARASFNDLILFHDSYPKKPKRIIAQFYSIQSSLFFAEMDIQSALSSSQKAITSFSSEGINDDPWKPVALANAFSLEDEIVFLKQKTKLFIEAYRAYGEEKYIDGALMTFDQVQTAIEKIIRETSFEDYKKKLVSENVDYSRDMVEFLIELIQKDNSNNSPRFTEQLLEISERTNSFLLLQKWKANTAQQEINIPLDLLAEKRKIDRTLGVIDYQYSQLIQTDSLDLNMKSELEKKRLDLLSQQARWLKKIEVECPLYYSAKYQTKSIDLADFQLKLSQDEAWVKFMSMDSILITFFITQEDFQTFFIDFGAKEVSTSVKQLLDAIQAQDLSSFSEQSTLLYTKLFGEIDHLSAYHKLTIVPDGPLCLLPFDLLATKSLDDISHFERIPYLIKTHTIKYNYSLRFYLEGLKSNAKRTTREDVLAFAPEINRNRMMALNVPEVTRDALVPLSGAEREVKNIQQYFQSALVMGQSATEAQFRQQAEYFSILHLATHGVIDPNQPLYSKLIFSQGTDSSDYDDGLLHTYELLNMKLNAQLTTLSACNTGYGEYQKGEGIISLARGFAYAGSPNLVMSLWAVPDQATANLMTKFYEGLANELDKDEALRQAKLWYLENSPPEKLAPYYWGAWVMIGNDQPIKGASTVWWYMLGGIILLCLALYMRYFFKKS